MSIAYILTIPSITAAVVPDPRRAIQDGVRFQRIRGTPDSLRMALKWVNVEDVQIEEEPPGKHFAEFQVGIHDVPQRNEFFVDNAASSIYGM